MERMSHIILHKYLRDANNLLLNYHVPNSPLPIFFQTLRATPVFSSTASSGNFPCKIVIEGLGLRAS